MGPSLLHRIFLVGFLIVGAAGFAAYAQSAAQPARIGLPEDWSSRHVVFVDGGSAQAMADAQRDPRMFLQWVRHNRQILLQAGAGNRTTGMGDAGGTSAQRRHPHPTDTGDWSVSLNTGNGGGLAPGQFPAKYTFAPIGSPDCVNDYVVMGLNVNGAANQANLVAFRNLYTNPSGTGFCSGLTAPTVKWAYNIGAHHVPTSVVLSLDGTKVAYVFDNATPEFHVLAPANGGSITAPQAAPSSPALQKVVLTGATTPTLASPYMDYATDTAYIASHNGRIYRIHPVFTGTPALDPTWTTNPIVVAGNPQLSSAVFDAVSGNLFVGGVNTGLLYGFHAATGAALSPATVTVGNGNANGGIMEGPIVDSSNGFVYAFAGDNNTSAVVVQAKTDFSSSVSANIGTRNKHPVHLGSFDDRYFSSSVSTGWSLYVCGIAGGGGNAPHLYRIGFNSSRVMNSSTDIGALSAANEQCSPTTEFLNGTTDWLFLGLLNSNVVNSYNITTTPANATAVSSKPANGGTSGIIVDNASTQAEASSIYYTTLKTDSSCGNRTCAVKRTQSGLN